MSRGRVEAVTSLHTGEPYSLTRKAAKRRELSDDLEVNDGETLPSE